LRNLDEEGALNKTFATEATGFDPDAAPAGPIIAAFAARLEVETLPAAVLARAKVCIMDALDNALNGAADSRTAIAIATLHRDKPGHSARIIGTASVAGAEDAAFVNGVMGATAVRNDIHVASGSHPGSIVVSAAFAVAEETGASGADVLAGIVAGYEVIARLGATLRAVERGRIFRPTTLSGAVGAAVACARVMRLDAAATAQAISLACHSAFGLNTAGGAATGEDVYQNGWSARHGVMAAILARSGGIGAPRALDGETSLLAAYGALARRPQVTDRLGDGFEILNVKFKPAPACNLVLTPAQVAYRLRLAHGINPSDITGMTLFVSDHAIHHVGCDNPGPVTNRNEAIMSLQFGVAAVMASGTLHDDNWATFGRAEVDRLAALCTLARDEGYSSAGARKGARLVVKLSNGREFSDALDDYSPLTDTESTDQFRSTLAHFGSETAADETMALLLRMETLDHAGAVMAGLPQLRCLDGVARR
jgi:2-methylcitrate dehydratase PrpD